MRYKTHREEIDALIENGEFFEAGELAAATGYDRDYIELPDNDQFQRGFDQAIRETWSFSL